MKIRSFTCTVAFVLVFLNSGSAFALHGPAPSSRDHHIDHSEEAGRVRAQQISTILELLSQTRDVATRAELTFRLGSLYSDQLRVLYANEMADYDAAMERYVRAD